MGIIDAYRAEKVYNQLLIDIKDLEDGEHSLKVTLTSDKNEQSKGYNAYVDYANIFKPIETDDTPMLDSFELEVGQSFKIPLI